MDSLTMAGVAGKYGSNAAEHLLHHCGAAQVLSGGERHLLVRQPTGDDVYDFIISDETNAQLRMTDHVCGREALLMMWANHGLDDMPEISYYASVIAERLYRQYGPESKPQTGLVIVTGMGAMSLETATTKRGRRALGGGQGGLFVPGELSGPYSFEEVIEIIEWMIAGGSHNGETLH